MAWDDEAERLVLQVEEAFGIEEVSRAYAAAIQEVLTEHGLPIEDDRGNRGTHYEGHDVLPRLKEKLRQLLRVH
ncbi:MAG: hypothetical protein LC791_16170 [Acidobacteria bacterium]|nr:hypothetical protein [Acidobacteriota bacterium]